MKVIIGSDHAGFDTKEELKKYLHRINVECEDAGAYSRDAVDYPDIALKVADKVAKSGGRAVRGVLICGTGTGMVIAANKVRGIRAAEAFDLYSARMSRHDNDANVLALRGRNFDVSLAKRILGAWLRTPFSNMERHKRRIKKISDIENNKL